jgi:hypothetical protein
VVPGLAPFCAKLIDRSCSGRANDGAVLADRDVAAEPVEFAFLNWSRMSPMEEPGLLDGKSSLAKVERGRWLGAASWDFCTALLNIVPVPAAVLETCEGTWTYANWLACCRALRGFGEERKGRLVMPAVMC